MLKGFDWTLAIVYSFDWIRSVNRSAFGSIFGFSKCFWFQHQDRGKYSRFKKFCVTKIPNMFDIIYFFNSGSYGFSRFGRHKAIGYDYSKNTLWMKILGYRNNEGIVEVHPSCQSELTSYVLRLFCSHYLSSHIRGI